MTTVKSSWTSTPVSIDGRLQSQECKGAGILPLWDLADSPFRDPIIRIALEAQPAPPRAATNAGFVRVVRSSALPSLFFGVLAIVAGSGCRGPAGPAGPAGPPGPPGATVTPSDPVIVSLESSLDHEIGEAASTAAAAAYCLANHSWTGSAPQFVSPEHPGGFTPSGYELPTLPIVGSVRRNFVMDRAASDDNVSANGQTCSTACRAFMSNYEPEYHGVALQMRHSNGTMQPDGLNDLGGLVGTIKDTDFSSRGDRSKKVFVGIRARVDNYLEADVAFADNCCCGLVAGPSPRKE